MIQREDFGESWVDKNGEFGEKLLLVLLKYKTFVTLPIQN